MRYACKYDIKHTATIDVKRVGHNGGKRERLILAGGIMETDLSKRRDMNRNVSKPT